MTESSEKHANYEEFTELPPKSESFYEKLVRRKHVPSDMLETPLNRCLTTLDVTLFGIGHMVGGGIYVLTGQVAKNITGPSILLSFLVAGFASLLSALCYAEFGARIPRAGSAYTYTYISVGEIWAFVIGWNIILEHVIGAAAVARTWSAYVNSLSGHWISNQTLALIGGQPMNERGFGKSFLSEYPDFLAVAILALVTIFMALGAKSSTRFNNVFTCGNLLVVSFIIGFGFYLADLKNWNLPDRGFAPFGYGNVIVGASRCFFAYIGFDSIATAAEEAKNPSKTVPRATFISMGVVTVAYMLMSSALTLMVPYYLINPDSAFAEAFQFRGLSWAKYVVAIGAICGITTAVTGHLFALPRCVYAMADDGLIFRCLACVSSRTRVPSWTIGLIGFLTSCVAVCISMETLIELLSIGTLLAYTIVSVSVVILRYRQPEIPKVIVKADFQTKTDCCGRSVNTEYLILVTLLCLVVLSAFQIGLVKFGWVEQEHWWAYFLFILLAGAICFCVGLIAVQEPNTVQLPFKVPLVPFLPCLSIYINILLMMSLTAFTWARLAVWMSIGFFVYFGYGYRKSSENVARNSKSEEKLKLVKNDCETSYGGISKKD